MFNGKRVFRYLANIDTGVPLRPPPVAAPAAGAGTRHQAANTNAARRAQGGRDQATIAMNIADAVMRVLVAWLPLGPA